jgi:drug/metabolite transporter (DMT)-like permease
VNPSFAGDALALASATCFAVSNVTIARGARDSEDNGAFVSLLLTAAIAGTCWAIVGAARGFEPVTARALAWFAGAGVLTAFVGRVSFYASVERLGAMRSAALKRLIPFFAVVLGVVVLSEELTRGMAAGLVLILASFGVLVATRARADRGSAARLSGYAYAVVSALGYASGYLLRKMGLAEAHDALLGAMVGTLVAAALFVATAAFRADYARAVRSTFARPKGWLIVAGTMASVGQILYFAALNVSPMSRVALISSIEVFMTIFLAAAFLRNESLNAPVIVAAILGVAGTAAIFAV